MSIRHNFELSIPGVLARANQTIAKNAAMGFASWAGWRRSGTLLYACMLMMAQNTEENLENAVSIIWMS